MVIKLKVCINSHPSVRPVRQGVLLENYSVEFHINKCRVSVN